MADVFDVAKYILTLAEDDVDEGISNMKLQKLLYYCQGFHLAMKNTPLFNAEIEAWAHGPVIPSIYQEYKDYGANVIPRPVNFNLDSVSSEEKEVINEVYSYYGQFSAWGLRNMTHNELPWKSTMQNEVIEKTTLASFFKTQLK